ncbi:MULTISPECIES: lysis system i-spanin subunit Rz [unclassified Pseudomonas]|uniref:lysis system i-spanin subunit Rz n=1 Tax=unclassified Pseudomonas TaxID=196821 RepID=UPI00244B88BF|nr:MULTISPECIES: lysis system i-spanin subunit Rz [unclassified Pseudomonas]MDH0300570.1 lysis protein [Pseudomonas sp. GD04091]MDH1984279.1 lysis protein [Pseudomonas sp. GD03689]
MNRLRLGLCGVLMLLCAAVAWQVQSWRLGQQLAEQEQELVRQRLDQAEALHRLMLAERERRLSLERRLQDSEAKHFQELNDAQQSQARLRDRLATADLRLSVLVERDASCTTVPAATATSGLDHGPVRARLDPQNARRIIAITDDGDRGLIALRACQDHLRALAQPDR